MDTLPAVLPEIDDIDGFAFVGFERQDEMDSYAKTTRGRMLATAGKRGRTANIPFGRAQRGGKKAGKAKTKSSGYLLMHQRLSVNAKKRSGAKGGDDQIQYDATGPRGPKPRAGAKPILPPQKSRFRKSDKKTISEKLCGFVFVSGFTLDDLDNYVAPPLKSYSSTSAAPRKRKAETEGSADVTAVVTSKAKKKAPTKKTYRGKVANHPETLVSVGFGVRNADCHQDPVSCTMPTTKRKAEDEPKRPPKAAKMPGGKVDSPFDTFLSTVGFTDLTDNDQRQLSNLISSTITISDDDSDSIPSTNTVPGDKPNVAQSGGPESSKVASMLPKLDLDKLFKRLKAHRQPATKKEQQGKKLPRKPASSMLTGSKTSKKKTSVTKPRPPLKKALPSIDAVKGGDTISSDSESDTLDICGIDDITSSTEFILNNINNTPKALDPKAQCEAKKDKTKAKTKKRKCKTCCEHPCKITEAKRVSALWGSSFPSYSVSCVYTCRTHLPGEIHELPNKTKAGSVDTSIQTTASDIEMHSNFAERFPHRAIAVETHTVVPIAMPKQNFHTPGEMVAKLLYQSKKGTSKSETHRSMEQKRREQLHFLFVGLRKAVCVSKAISENDRASKQWILEEALKVINSLKVESMFLTTLKNSLSVKNERLRKKWTELSGKKFDPKMSKGNANDASKSKLMDLYKQYRKDMQKGRPTSKPEENTEKTSLNAVEYVEESSSSSASEELESSTPSLTNPNGPVVISDDEDIEPATSTKKFRVSSGNVSSSNVSTSERMQPTPASPGNKFTRAGIKNRSYQPQLHRQVVHKQPESKVNQVPPSSTVTKPTTSTVTKPKEVVIPPKLKQPFHLIVTPCPRNPSQGSTCTNVAPTPNQIHTTPPKSSRSLPVLYNTHTNSVVKSNSVLHLPVVDMVSAVNKASHQLVLDGVCLSKKQHSNSSPVFLGKPSQWTTFCKMPVFKNNPIIQHLGAVEVIETDSDLPRSPEVSSEQIVLLDVAETEKKSPAANVGDNARTVSFVPSSTSISLTLNSVGSITSNKINNKKPLPTSKPDFLNTVHQPPKSTATTTPLATGLKPILPKPLSPTTAPVNPVPQISDTLLSTIDGTNETGLCVISDVFSLSDSPPKPTQDAQPEKNLTNLQLINNVIDKHCSKQIKEHNACSSLTHDHNYFKTDLQNNVKQMYKTVLDV